MTALDIIDDPKHIQVFLSEMDKWSSIYRSTLAEDDRVVFSGGMVFHNMDVNNLYRYTETKFELNKRMEPIYDILVRNVFTIDFFEYFEFRKNKKDKVASITFSEADNKRYLSITRENGESLESVISNTTNIPATHNKMFKGLRDNFNKLVTEVKFNTEQIARMRDRGNPYKLYVDSNTNSIELLSPFINDKAGKNGVYEIILKDTDVKGIEYKVLKKGPVASDVTVSLWQIENDSQMSMFEFVIKTPTYSSKQCFITINY